MLESDPAHLHNLRIAVNLLDDLHDACRLIGEHAIDAEVMPVSERRFKEAVGTHDAVRADELHQLFHEEELLGGHVNTVEDLGKRFLGSFFSEADRLANKDRERPLVAND